MLFIECKQIEQIHLSLGSDSISEMMLTWLTFNASDEVPSVVYYEKGETNSSAKHLLTASGYTEQFIDGGSQGKIRYIHRVKLNHLMSGRQYYYRIHQDDTWYSFKTIDGSTKKHKHLIFGDLGYEGGKLTTALQGELDEGDVSTMIQVGDMAYDLHSDDGTVGDLFMNMMQPMIATVPFQVLPGNHESAYNFSHYDARFTMIDQTSDTKNNHFYSFNVGLVHFVVFSTEYYRFTEYGTRQIENQYNWLREDLTFASSPANRTLRPWIVVLSHTPFYTKNLWAVVDSRRVTGHLLNPEKLFYDASVDIIICGHLHVYQRSWPIFNGKIYKKFYNEKSKAYVNSKAPIHLITGTGGCHYGLSPPKIYTISSDFIAFIDNNFSYTVMTVHNESHLQFEQKSAHQCNSTIDQFFILKTPKHK